MSEERKRDAKQTIATCFISCGIFTLLALNTHSLTSMYLAFFAAGSLIAAYGVYETVFAQERQERQRAHALCIPHRDRVPITQRYQQPAVHEPVMLDIPVIVPNVKPKRERKPQPKTEPLRRVKELPILIEDWPVRVPVEMKARK